MEKVVIALHAVAVLVILSVRANTRYRTHERLPMQWSFAGEVTSSAPRWVALALVPVLGIVILTGMTNASLMMTPRPDQEWSAVSAVALVALCLVGCQLFHLWMIARTVELSSG